MFIHWWYAVNGIFINLIIFDLRGLTAYDTVTRRSTYYLSTTISQMWETIMQYLPWWAGPWPILVCLLAWRIAPALWLRWKGASWSKDLFATRDFLLTAPPRSPVGEIHILISYQIWNAPLHWERMNRPWEPINRPPIFISCLGCYNSKTTETLWQHYLGELYEMPILRIHRIAGEGFARHWWCNSSAARMWTVQRTLQYIRTSREISPYGHQAWPTSRSLRQAETFCRYQQSLWEASAACWRDRKRCRRDWAGIVSAGQTGSSK